MTLRWTSKNTTCWLGEYNKTLHSFTLENEKIESDTKIVQAISADYQNKYVECKANLEKSLESVDVQVTLKTQKIQQNLTECHKAKEGLISSKMKLEEAEKAHQLESAAGGQALTTHVSELEDDLRKERDTVGSLQT